MPYLHAPEVSLIKWNSLSTWLSTCDRSFLLSIYHETCSFNTPRMHTIQSNHGNCRSNPIRSSNGLCHRHACRCQIELLLTPSYQKELLLHQRYDPQMSAIIEGHQSLTKILMSLSLVETANNVPSFNASI
jgi:hypothetical protein